MTNKLASDYADSMAKDILDNTRAGYPFGKEEYVDEHSGEHNELTAYDYLDDALDIEYRVDFDGKYRSAKILVGFGGPNVWVDTAQQTLSVYWDSLEVRDLPNQFCDLLDEALSEVWGMR